MVMNWFKGGSNQPAANESADGGAPATAAPPARNLFRDNMYYDFSAYLSPTPTIDFDNDTLFWQMEKLTFGLWSEGPDS